jgi:NAD(P)-dependent dehydrogenase (short-subunit alcohol dehydrogenase family)
MRRAGHWHRPARRIRTTRAFRTLTGRVNTSRAVSVRTVLVVGASRGIGLEFVRQYAAVGARVLATHRDDEAATRLRALGATPLPLDVRDCAAVSEFGRLLGAGAIDLAIVSAGVYGPRSSGLEAPAVADFDHVMRTNVLAPMHLIRALAEPVAAARGTIAVLSSRMGSVSQMGSAAGWLYRASKAALNSVMKSASIELGPRGIVCLALHPGWVRTDMGGAEADLDVASSVAGMRCVLAAADGTANGGFFDYTGERIAF